MGRADHEEAVLVEIAAAQAVAVGTAGARAAAGEADFRTKTTANPRGSRANRAGNRKGCSLAATAHIAPGSVCEETL